MSMQMQAGSLPPTMGGDSAGLMPGSLALTIPGGLPPSQFPSEVVPPAAMPGHSSEEAALVHAAQVGKGGIFGSNIESLSQRLFDQENSLVAEAFGYGPPSQRQAPPARGVALGLGLGAAPRPGSFVPNAGLPEARDGRLLHGGSNLRGSEQAVDPGSPTRNVKPVSGLNAIAGALYVRILSARKLRNGDTGLFGDVSDPYVVVRVGQVVHHTPVIENDLNPVWDHGHEFVFPVTAKDGTLSLEIMNSNVVRDSSLGYASMPLWGVPVGQWERYNKELKGANTGELEFEMRFDRGVKPNPALLAGRSWLSPHVLGAPGNGPLNFSLQGVFHDAANNENRAHALLLEGVRVLEIGRRTWSASLCGRMLAACGADVIRIAFGEEAALAAKRARPRTSGGVYGSDARGEGQTGPGLHAGKAEHHMPIGRGGFGPDGQHHNAARHEHDLAKVAAIPPVLNAGKRLLPYESTKNFANLLRSQLLPECDIILTDLPMDELTEIGLGYQNLRHDFPGMIFAHTSCIGVEADMEQRGTDDAGAFFCLTGFAEQLGHYLGPRGFAAATSASTLFGVTCLALVRRRCGGRGDRVELSIFRAGKMCTALGTLTEWEKPTRPLNHPALHAHTHLPSPPRLPFDVLGAASVDVGRKPLGPVQQEHLTGHGPQHGGHPGHGGHLPPGHGVRSSQGQPLTFFTWRPREQRLKPPPPREDHSLALEDALGRLSVIEVGDDKNITMATVGSLLGDLGAQVTKVERRNVPDPWKQLCPRLYEELNGRKSVQEVELPSVLDQAAIYRSLSETTMLVTNLPGEALDAWGLNIEQLRVSFPHLIIVLISAWGCDVEGRKREMREGAKGSKVERAFWDASGLGDQCFASIEMPPGLAELSVAQHAIAGIGLALLRQQQTGKGQLVHVGAFQAGLYARNVSEIDPPAPGASPLLRTRDGRYMRLLGRGHKPHDAWVLLHAVGRRSSLWDRFRGDADSVRQFLHELSWEDVQRSHAELLECAQNWKYDDLAKAFLDRGIDWYCEEMRPTDEEQLHKERERDIHRTKEKLNIAAEKHVDYRRKAEELERRVQEAEVKHHAMLTEDRDSLSRDDGPPELQDLRKSARDLEDKIQMKNRRDLQKFTPSESQYRQVQQELVSVEKQIQDLERQERGFKRAWFTSSPEGQKEHNRVESALQKMYCERRKLQSKERDHEYHLHGGALPPTYLGMLRVRIHGAERLELDKRGAGFLQQVPSCDPYVVVRFGDVEYKTTTAFGKQSPIWDDEDATFDFRVTEVGHEVEIQVMNACGDSCFGTTRINPRRLKHNTPESFTEPLLGSDASKARYTSSRSGEVMFDLTFDQKGRWIDMCKLAELRAQLDQHSTDYDKQKRLGTADRPELGKLEVRQLHVEHLQPLSQGPHRHYEHDVPCPYVRIFVGRETYRTPSFKNDLNPYFEDIFDFRVVDDGTAFIEFIVLDDQGHRDERDHHAFGRSRVDLRALKNKEWDQFSLPLRGGRGTIKCECCFSMSTLWVENLRVRDMRLELEKAQAAQERATQEFKQLEQMVEMANYSKDWLMKIGNGNMPLSVGERAFQDLCKNRNVIIPTWLDTQRIERWQDDQFKQVQRPRPKAIALFPDVCKVDSNKRVRIIIRGATGLRARGSSRRAPGYFARCEVPGKPESTFETPVIYSNSNQPEWNYEKVLKAYSFDGTDKLVFLVCSDSDVIGKAMLNTEDFYPNGFDKFINIGSNAMLRLMVIVTEDAQNREW
jgi:crotonobetainyl-CoA:carnitine CoA-transferase CaiB-like acyl-CoA transferase